MRYKEFENILSSARMSRYLTACSGDSKKAMLLYRLNLRLSQELLTVISCFEVALRNSINTHCLTIGSDWLKSAAVSNGGGVFDNRNCKMTANTINEAVQKLNHHYSHNKLVAELGFGFWRYMFASHQYAATGKRLLGIFPQKPVSTATIQYNNIFVFNQLAKLNNLRNRIAHHEPICFEIGKPVKSTLYIRQHYAIIKLFFQWMAIDDNALLYGLNHVISICNRIDDL
jgi:hypothetical protein